MRSLVAHRGPYFWKSFGADLESNGNFNIPAQGGGSAYGDFKNDINDYLGSVGQPAVVNEMTQNYWNTYTQAIINAAPPQQP